MVALTKEHLMRAGARLRRSGGWSAERATRWCETQHMSVRQMNWTLAGFAAEMAREKQGPTHGKPLLTVHTRGAGKTARQLRAMGETAKRASRAAVRKMRGA